MRRLRDVILGADRRMSERVKYGSVMFFHEPDGDFAAFVQVRKPGVNLMLMSGGRLEGRYPHLEGATVKRLRVADEAEATARASELRRMVKEWCALQPGAGERPLTTKPVPRRHRRA